MVASGGRVARPSFQRIKASFEGGETTGFCSFSRPRLRREICELLESDVQLVGEGAGPAGLCDEVIDSLAERHDQCVQPRDLVSN